MAPFNLTDLTFGKTGPAALGTLCFFIVET